MVTKKTLKTIFLTVLLTQYVQCEEKSSDKKIFVLQKALSGFNTTNSPGTLYKDSSEELVRKIENKIYRNRHAKKLTASTIHETTHRQNIIVDRNVAAKVTKEDRTVPNIDVDRRHIENEQRHPSEIKRHRREEKEKEEPALSVELFNNIKQSAKPTTVNNTVCQKTDYQEVTKHYKRPFDISDSSIESDTARLQNDDSSQSKNIVAIKNSTKTDNPVISRVRISSYSDDNTSSAMPRIVKRRKDGSDAANVTKKEREVKGDTREVMNQDGWRSSKHERRSQSAASDDASAETYKKRDALEHESNSRSNGPAQFPSFPVNISANMATANQSNIAGSRSLNDFDTSSDAASLKNINFDGTVRDCDASGRSTFSKINIHLDNQLLKRSNDENTRPVYNKLSNIFTRNETTTDDENIERVEKNADELISKIDKLIFPNEFLNRSKNSKRFNSQNNTQGKIHLFKNEYGIFFDDKSSTNTHNKKSNDLNKHGIIHISEWNFQKNVSEKDNEKVLLETNKSFVCLKNVFVSFREFNLSCEKTNNKKSQARTDRNHTSRQNVERINANSTAGKNSNATILNSETINLNDINDLHMTASEKYTEFNMQSLGKDIYVKNVPTETRDRDLLKSDAKTDSELLKSIHPNQVLHKSNNKSSILNENHLRVKNTSLSNRDSNIDVNYLHVNKKYLNDTHVSHYNRLNNEAILFKFCKDLNTCISYNRENKLFAMNKISTRRKSIEYKKNYETRQKCFLYIWMKGKYRKSIKQNGREQLIKYLLRSDEMKFFYKKTKRSTKYTNNKYRYRKVIKEHGHDKNISRLELFFDIINSFDVEEEVFQLSFDNFIYYHTKNKRNKNIRKRSTENYTSTLKGHTSDPAKNNILNSSVFIENTKQPIDTNLPNNTQKNANNVSYVNESISERKTFTATDRDADVGKKFERNASLKNKSDDVAFDIISNNFTRTDHDASNKQNINTTYTSSSSSRLRFNTKTLRSKEINDSIEEYDIQINTNVASTSSVDNQTPKINYTIDRINNNDTADAQRQNKYRDGTSSIKRKIDTTMDNVFKLNSFRTNRHNSSSAAERNTTETPLITFSSIPNGDPMTIGELGLTDSWIPFNYLSSFLRFLKPSNFPSALIRDSMWKRVSITNLIWQALRMERIFISFMAIGIFFALAVPFSMIAITCCRFVKHNEQNSPENPIPWDNIDGEISWIENFKRRIYVFIMQILLVFMSIGVVVMFVTNEQLSQSVRKSYTVVETTFNDIDTYIRNSHMQIAFLVTTSFDQAMGYVTNDLNDVQELLGRPIQRELAMETGIDVALDALMDVSRASQDIALKVEELLDEGHKAEEVARTGAIHLRELKRHVETVSHRCVARDAPLCGTLDVSRLEVTFKVEKLLMDHNFRHILYLAQDNLTILAAEAKEEFLSIPARIITDTTKSRHEISTILKRRRDGIFDSLRKFDEIAYDLALAVKKGKHRIIESVRTINKLEHWRWLIFLCSATSILLIWFLILSGISCGCCGSESNAGPSLHVAVFLICLLSICHWGITIVTFLIGGHGEVFICQVLYDEPDYRILSKFLDKPALLYNTGGLFSNMLNANESVDVPVANILRNCEKNHAVYPTFKLHSIHNIDSVCDHRTWTDLHNEFKGVKVNVKDFRLLTPDVQKHLNELVQTSTVNFAKHRSALSGSVTGKDLKSFANQLESISHQITDLDTASKMETLVTRAKKIIKTLSEPLEKHKDNIIYQLTALEVRMLPFQKQANQSTAHLKTIQYYFENEGGVIANQKTQEYTARLANYMEQFKEHVLDVLNKTVATCGPLWDAYHITRLFLCQHLITPLNAFWISTTWCLFWFLFVIPICMELAKCYGRLVKSKRISNSNLNPSTSQTGW